MKCCRPECEKEATLGLQLLFCRPGMAPQEAWAKVGICKISHAPTDEELHAMLEINWPYIQLEFESHGALPPILDDSGYAWVPIDLVDEQFLQAKAFLTDKRWRN